jgi:hypothetical protein
MSRTYRITDADLPPGRYTWGKLGRGKWHKRAHNKAVRRAWKGTGKERSVASWTSECKWKGT